MELLIHNAKDSLKQRMLHKHLNSENFNIKTYLKSHSPFTASLTNAIIKNKIYKK